MSRIDELIAELCPAGVHHAVLGEVGSFIRGNGIQKKDFTESGVGCIHYGQIFTHFGLAATETKSFVSPELAARSRKAMPGDLVIATTSENDEDVCKAVAWLGGEPVAVSSDAFIYRHSLEPKFVSYFFNSRSFQEQKRPLISGTKVRRVSGEGLAKIRIPVPPLEIQREIVRVLDKFSQLEVELEVELEARHRQYELYRDVLLTADAHVRKIALGDLGKWYGGGTPAKSVRRYWDDGTIPWLSPKDMTGDNVNSTQDRIAEAAINETPLRLVPANSVAVVVRSNILRRRLPIARVAIATALNQDMRALVPAAGLLGSYAFFAIRASAEEILATAGRTDGSMAAIESARLMSFKIPVPELVEQERIVAFLDMFDALVNDLSDGLPAELLARRKQYEHYRDRLLTFKELAA